MNRSEAALDEAGRVERITGVAADVTDRRLAQEALRQSEERFRIAASAGRVGIWEWKVAENVVLWSESLYAIHGLEKGQFSGTVEAFAELIAPEDRERVNKSIRDSLENNTPYEIEFRAIRPDGGTVWIYTQATVVRSSLGVAQRMIGATVDISQRKRAEEALMETDRRKDEFLATLAHELRNPLAPIRTAVQLLNHLGTQEPESQQIRDMVERQVDHLVRLVDDLLDLSRINRGKVTLRRQPAKLTEIVQTAIETSTPFITANGHILEMNLSAEPLLIDGDAVRLTQVVANLLNNAAKYTPQGGRITVTVERNDQHGVIRVRDTGLGIPREMLENVFEMFAQVNRHLGRAQGGLGIGLTLVRQLVELHGGDVQARSEGEGTGAEFVVRLPLIDQRTETTIPKGDEEFPVKPRRVLVVDDNVDAAISLARLFTLKGHQVKTAHDGLSGIQEVTSFRPEVVLLDLGMPGIDGFETARRIRASEPGHKVLLIALTGWGLEEDRRRTRDSGFDHHFVKPVNFSELEKLLHKEWLAVEN